MEIIFHFKVAQIIGFDFFFLIPVDGNNPHPDFQLHLQFAPMY